MTITRGDVAIEQGLSDWGGPLIKITVSSRLVEPSESQWRPGGHVRIFEVKHTRGLENMSSRDRGHGWHVQEALSESSGWHWHGVLEARDPNNPEAAIDEMISYLNFLAARDRVSEAMQGYLSDIAETLGDFNQSLEFRSRRDHTEEWPKFIAAVAAADEAFRAASR